jgi:hypothetical protein
VSENSQAYYKGFLPSLKITSEYETIFWQKLDGPGNVFFSDATTEQPTIYATSPGDYVLTATVTTKTGLSSVVEYSFTWINIAPEDFSIKSPLNVSAILQPTINWEKAEDLNTLSYEVVIYEADCSTVNQKKSGITSTAYTLEKSLVDNKEYCVSVTATDVHGAATKATNDKDFSFNTDTSLNVVLSGSFSWTNEASDGFIKYGEESSTNPVAVFTAVGGSVTYTSLLDETSPQTCDASKTYSLTSIPTINSITIDGPYSICAKITGGLGQVLYVKSPSTLNRDVILPSVTADVQLDTAGVFADNRIDATEFQAATNVVSTGIVAVGADTIGYSFVASGDDCNKKRVSKRG